MHLEGREGNIKAAESGTRARKFGHAIRASNVA